MHPLTVARCDRTTASTTNSTAAHTAIATAPSAARGARLGSITKGSNTIDAVSAIAICAVTDSTGGPSSFSESMTGNANAADDDAISTAYSAACPVPKTCASPTPRHRRDRADQDGPQQRSGDRAPRKVASRTGTWVPTTNITSAKPMLASRLKVGSEWSITPNPVLPKTIPAASSPDHHRDRAAAAPTRQRAGHTDHRDQRQRAEAEAGHLCAIACHDTSRHGITVFSSVM